MVIKSGCQPGQMTGAANDSNAAHPKNHIAPMMLMCVVSDDMRTARQKMLPQSTADSVVCIHSMIIF